MTNVGVSHDDLTFWQNHIRFRFRAVQRLKGRDFIYMLPTDNITEISTYRWPNLCWRVWAVSFLCLWNPWSCLIQTLTTSSNPWCSDAQDGKVDHRYALLSCSVISVKLFRKGTFPFLQGIWTVFPNFKWLEPLNLALECVQELSVSIWKCS